MRDGGVERILLLVLGDGLSEGDRETSADLFASRTQAQRRLIVQIGFIVDEAAPESGGEVPGSTVVVGRGIGVLAIAVRKRFLQFLTTEVHFRLKQSVADSSSDAQASDEGGREIVVSGDVKAED